MAARKRSGLGARFEHFAHAISRFADEGELEVLHRHYRSLAELAKGEGDIRKSHSLDEAGQRHQIKLDERKRPRR